jgi:hypothetical protein
LSFFKLELIVQLLFSGFTLLTDIGGNQRRAICVNVTRFPESERQQGASLSLRVDICSMNLMPLIKK